MTTSMKGGFQRDDSTGALLVTGGGGAYGTLAARPAAGAVTDGATYFVTDDNGGALYQAQAGAWVMIGPKGVELNYAALAVGQASITTEAVITGLDTFTVTFRDRPVMIHFHCGLVFNGTSGAQIVVRLRDITGISNPTASQGTLLDVATITAAAANAGGPVELWARIAAQTPGTQKIYKITGRAPTGSATVAGADGGSSTFIEAVER